MSWTAWRSDELSLPRTQRDSDLADALLRLPVLRGLADSRSTRCELVQLPDGSSAVRKLWTWPSARDRWRGAFRTTIGARSPATRERQALTRLALLPNGPLAPAPLAAADERKGGVLVRCLLLLVEVPDAVQLAEWLIAERSQAARAAILDDLAARVAAMHSAGLLDRDLHPRNVLVQPAAARIWIVDSPKQRVTRARVGAKRAALDLAALDVGFQRLAERAERERFFAAYLAARPDIDSKVLLERVDVLRQGMEPRQLRRLPPTRLPPDGVT